MSLRDFKHIAETKPEAFLEKSVGVAMPGYRWVQTLGLLIHILQNEELAQDLFEDADTFDEMVIVVKSIQKQVLGIQEKILTAENCPEVSEEFKKKIVIV